MGTATLIVACKGETINCDITVLAPVVPIQSISLNKTTESLKVGQGVDLTVSVSPSNATELPDEFDWEFPEDKVERIMIGNNTGELEYSAQFRALAVGTAIITAKVPGTNISASCMVTISEADIEMTGIAFDKADTEVEIFDSITVNASIEPANTTNPPTTLIWEVGDNTILEEDTSYSNGSFSKKYNAKKIGETTITASTPDGKVEKTITVEVVGNQVTELFINKSTLTIEEEGIEAIEVTWNPEIVVPTPTVSIGLPEGQTVVEVDNYNISDNKCMISLKGKNAGNVTLLVDVEGKTVSCNITVEPKKIEIESITLNKSNAFVKVGDHIALRINVSPTDATELPDEYDWEISNTDLIEVETSPTYDNSEPTARVFKALAVGTATITARVPGTNIEATCDVTISDTDVDMTDLTFDKSTAEIEIYDTVTLTASIIPENATNAPDDLVWTIEDEDILKEDTSAANSAYVKTFKAIGIGQTTITAKTEDESFEVSATITVVGNSVESLLIDKTYLPIELDQEDTIEITWNPESVIPEPDVEIEIEDEQVATAAIQTTNDKKCLIKVTPQNIGRTTLTASVGDKEVNCEIVVLSPTINIQSISLDKETANIEVGKGVELTISVNPQNATELPNEFNWELSNDNLERIMIGNDTGELNYSAQFKGLKEGSTTITAKVPNTNITASCVVTVVAAQGDPTDTTDTGDTSDTGDTTDTTSGLEVEIINYEETENGNKNYIANDEETTLSQLLSNIETNGTVKVYVNGQEVTNSDTKLPTGAVVEITKGNQKVTFELVVYGDINGDANIDDIDLLKLARYNAGFEDEVNSVKGAYLMAANLKNDNSYGDDSDLLKLARFLVGLE